MFVLLLLARSPRGAEFEMGWSDLAEVGIIDGNHHHGRMFTTLVHCGSDCNATGRLGLGAPLTHTLTLPVTLRRRHSFLFRGSYAARRHSRRAGAQYYHQLQAQQQLVVLEFLRPANRGNTLVGGEKTTVGTATLP